MRIGEASSDSTWEVSSSLPKQLVDEFENGVHRDLIDETFTSGGETVHTLSSTPVSRQSVKRLKLDIPSTLKIDERYVMAHN